MSNLQKTLKFTNILHVFRRVKRVVFVNGEDRQENDTEHSYQLAMLAWYIIDSCTLDLNKEKVIKYALVHDLVEVYAGDTYIYSNNQKHIDSKNKRERESLNRLEKEFPEAEDIFNMIHVYEKKEDDESRFIYALDKLQPLFNIYLDNGRTWKENKITLDMIIKHKKYKVATSAIVEKYFNELIKVIEKSEKKLTA